MEHKQTVQHTHFGEVEGFQHSQDGYYYRPLIFGANLFTYVAHVPPGGVMPADAEEAELFELSLYMLHGSLFITYGDQQFTIDKHSALYIPRGVAFGVHNQGDETASFVLTFTPPPSITSLEDIRNRYRERGGNIVSLDEMKKMVANTLE
jgi:glyoxylate utilization-related uncharacterized protein